jgi:hypothetical protein
MIVILYGILLICLIHLIVFAILYGNDDNRHRRSDSGEQFALDLINQIEFGKLERGKYPGMYINDMQDVLLINNHPSLVNHRVHVGPFGATGLCIMVADDVFAIGPGVVYQYPTRKTAKRLIELVERNINRFHSVSDMNR